jgi:hypothetical protein
MPSGSTQDGFNLVLEFRSHPSINGASCDQFALKLPEDEYCNKQQCTSDAGIPWALILVSPQRHITDDYTTQF